MTPQLLILIVLGIPLLTAFSIYITRSIPDVREEVTLVGAVALFGSVIWLTSMMGSGAAIASELGEAAPGLVFAFKLEPLGALFALVASGLWIVNSFYSIGYMRGNRERNQTRFYMCFAFALFGAVGVAMAGNLFTLFVFYEVLTISTYPLVAHKGDDKARKGARIYLLTLLGTSIGMFLVAIVWTNTLAGNLDFVPGGLLDGKVDTVTGLSLIHI